MSGDILERFLCIETCTFTKLVMYLDIKVCSTNIFVNRSFGFYWFLLVSTGFYWFLFAPLRNGGKSSQVRLWL